MKFILVLSLLVASCSETTSPRNDVGRDSSVSDLQIADSGRDQNPKIDLSKKDADLDVGKNEDVVLEDASPVLSNAIDITEVSTTIDEVGAVVPLDRSENALPFLTASYRFGDPTLPYLHVDATIENGELLLARSLDLLVPVDEFVSVSGQVVAFDPGRIQIQCKDFQTSDGTARIDFDRLRKDQSFLNFWYRIETGSNDKNVAFMSARFETDTRIILERFSPAGRVTGHLCVTESLGDAFSVQHVVSKIEVGETEVVVPIEAVDLTSSLVFISHRTTRADSKPGYSQVSCELETSAVRCLRGLNEAEISDLRIQVVTFKDRTTVSRFTVVIEEGEKEVRVEMPGLVGKSSVVFGSMGVLGEVSSSAIQKPDVPASYVEAVVDDGGIVFKRGEPWNGRLEFYPQIVTW